MYALPFHRGEAAKRLSLGLGQRCGLCGTASKAIELISLCFGRRPPQMRTGIIA